MAVADARDLFTGSVATYPTGSFRDDFLAWQDSIAALRLASVFDSAANPVAAQPPEFAGVSGGAAGITARASDHRPVFADLVLPAPCADGTVRWSHFAVRLSERFGRDDRDSILQGLLRHDIAATSVMYVLPLEPAFANTAANADFRIAQRAADRLIALPFSTSLSERDIDLICQTLQVMIERQTILR